MRIGSVLPEVVAAPCNVRITSRSDPHSPSSACARAWYAARPSMRLFSWQHAFLMLPKAHSPHGPRSAYSAKRCCRDGARSGERPFKLVLSDSPERALCGGHGRSCRRPPGPVPGSGSLAKCAAFWCASWARMQLCASGTDDSQASRSCGSCAPGPASWPPSRLPASVPRDGSRLRTVARRSCAQTGRRAAELSVARRLRPLVRLQMQARPSVPHSSLPRPRHEATRRATGPSLPAPRTLHRQRARPAGHPLHTFLPLSRAQSHTPTRPNSPVSTRSPWAAPPAREQAARPHSRGAAAGGGGARAVRAPG
jgi:hypothetical protein